MHSPNEASRRLTPENIAEILVSEDEVSEERMQEALNKQREEHVSLGEILVSDGYVTSEDLSRILSRHLNMEYVVLSQEEVDPDLIGIVAEETLVNCEAIPLRVENGKLVVAMSDPANSECRSCVVESAGLPIVPVVAAEDAIRVTRERLLQDKRQRAESPSSGNGSGNGGQPNTPPNGRRSRGRLGSSRIGDILVEQGKISEEQLQQALNMQDDDPRNLGEILISLGLILPADLAQALARRLRLEYIELSDTDVDRGLTSLIDHKVLRRHGAVPLRMQDGRLLVAMSDPKDIYALEDLRMISGYPITPVVATQPDIQRVQNKLFALGEGVSEFLEEAAIDSVSQDDGEVDLGADAGPDEAPIIRLVSSILQQAVGEGASDIHIEPQAQEVTVRFRVDGVLREVMSVPYKLQSGITARLKVIANLNIAERRVPQDGRFSVRIGGSKVDLRVATLPTAYGEKLVLRLLDTSNVEANLRKLGFSGSAFERYEKVFTRPYGAILVTGPTGSGKSTTLYATLNELNSPGRNIITVEDPVEYRVPGLNQIQVNPRAGLTFASGLRSILRSDPDIIMIGEIRDVETAKISVESALTGHLVLATLHTNNAPGALTRLTEMGVEPFLTSSAVDCVIAQRLGRRLCERCKQPAGIER
ncbi:MAG: ATPase, T2SS/T4P/T4SS family, partial [Rubrobacteraceae bacterium]